MTVRAAYIDQSCFAQALPIELQNIWRDDTAPKLNGFAERDEFAR